jgi:hypothetical protein
MRTLGHNIIGKYVTYFRRRIYFLVEVTLKKSRVFGDLIQASNDFDL